MPVVQTVTCDAAGCGKDITKGAGRQWRMQAYSQVIPADPEITLRVDQGDMTPLLHFCDHRCLATWSTAAADTADARQATYEQEQADAKKNPPPAPAAE